MKFLGFLRLKRNGAQFPDELVAVTDKFFSIMPLVTREGGKGHSSPKSEDLLYSIGAGCHEYLAAMQIPLSLVWWKALLVLSHSFVSVVL